MNEIDRLTQTQINDLGYLYAKRLDMIDDINHIDEFYSINSACKVLIEVLANKGMYKIVYHPTYGFSCLPRYMIKEARYLFYEGIIQYREETES